MKTCINAFTTPNPAIRSRFFKSSYAFNHAMLNFTKRLKTEDGFLNFYFNARFSASGIRYYVSVVDGERKTQIFHMVKGDKGWVLENVKSCPFWITMMENELSNQIMEHHG